MEFARKTGARLSEILAVDDQVDIDFRAGDMTLKTLKRQNQRKKGIRRIVPIPAPLITETAMYPGSAAITTSIFILKREFLQDKNIAMFSLPLMEKSDFSIVL